MISSKIQQFYTRNRRLILNAGVLFGAGSIYVGYHLERAPITGRRRFMAISKNQEQMLSDYSFKETLHEYSNLIYPQNHPLTIYVRSVAERIIDSMKLYYSNSNNSHAKDEWKVFVVHSQIPNAFVLPGGQIFVFDGLLKVASTQDSLAVVLGHEMAHRVARHASEKMSLYQIIYGLLHLGQLIFTGNISSGPLTGIFLDLIAFLPFSRACESEADHLGLLFAASACFQIEEAVALWKKMQYLQQNSKGSSAGGGKIPSLLSTHPLPQSRIKDIQKWIPEANQLKLERCQETFNRYSNFKRSFF